jgi:mycoredoxin
MIDKTARFRQGILYLALALTLALLMLDRTAAYMHRPSQDSTAIVVYTATWCPFCKSLKAYLRAHDIPYREYDVEKSIQGGIGFWALRGRGVPVTVVGPDIIYGFDRGKIDQSLAKLGYQVNSLLESATSGTEATQKNGMSEL